MKDMRDTRKDLDITIIFNDASAEKEMPDLAIAQVVAYAVGRFDQLSDVYELHGIEHGDGSLPEISVSFESGKITVKKKVPAKPGL